MSSQVQDFPQAGLSGFALSSRVLPFRWGRSVGDTEPLHTASWSFMERGAPSLVTPGWNRGRVGLKLWNHVGSVVLRVSIS